MKKQILLLCLALTSLCSYAQTITVKGVVTSASDKEPMIGEMCIRDSYMEETAYTTTQFRFYLFQIIRRSHTEFIFKTLTEIDRTVNSHLERDVYKRQEYDKNYFTHQDIIQGGTLEFQMGPNPNTNWGASALSLPPDNMK